MTASGPERFGVRRRETLNGRDVSPIYYGKQRVFVAANEPLARHVCRLLNVALKVGKGQGTPHDLDPNLDELCRRYGTRKNREQKGRDDGAS